MDTVQKQKRKVFSVEEKMKVIQRLRNGETNSIIANGLGVST